jgi:myo-inositol-1(or 4)-monophosphatase
VREYNDLVKLAERAAVRAGDYIRGAIRPAVNTWTEKGQRDFATEVDRAAEALIAETLTRDEPESVIVGEELSPGSALKGQLVWIVDPLDGTANFLHGYPQFGVSIGALVDGRLAAGVVHDVCRRRTYTAWRGGGAYEEGARIGVSTVSEPRLALMGTGFPFKALHLLPQYLSQFAAVLGATSGIRRAGSAALDLADVAAGRLDAFWELHLAPWDTAAGALLIREAGGVITRPDGSADVLSGADNGAVVAGNATMHRWLLNLLRTR